MDTILITPRSLSQGDHAALGPLRRAGFGLVMPAPGRIPDEAMLIAALPGCVGWIAGIEPVSDRAIAAADRLRVISRNGTGIDNLPLSLLQARGIAVCKADGTNARGVAELALALTLAGLRQIVPTHEGMRAGRFPRLIGREIAGATIGVVGLGAIGATFARLCLDLGAQVIGHDPFAPADRLVHPAFRLAPLSKVVTQVDAVSLHVPMQTDGRPLLDAGLLGTLRPGTVVVNTARAGLVDPSALFDALNAGRVACYATDVFDTEPPAPSPLLAHPHTILTSHIGGLTVGSVERSTVRAVENLLTALRDNAA